MTGVIQSCSRTHFRKNLTFALMAAFLALTPPSAHAQQPTPSTNDRYQKWLNEDVRWLITDQERANFKKLSDDKQRDQFVEVFWERRTPVPNTPQNSLKEEHYRRTAYANEHFAAGAVAGWKTDRGRFYIMYGPPDKVIRHAISDGTREIEGIQKTGLNSEEWRWKYIKGLGCNVILEFEDKCGCGEYRLALAENGVGHQERGVSPLHQFGEDCLIDQVPFP